MPADAPRIHTMPARALQSGFSRYIPASDDARRWGICVTDLGCTEIPAGSVYPPGKHPEQYTLNWKTGRILHEFQIVYITRGKGVFWSEHSGTLAIRPGSVFLLFPGIRHRYRPHRMTGWHEHWVGFTGDQAARVMEEFFSPRRPVIHTGINADIQTLFRDACTLAAKESFGFRAIIAAKTMEILAQTCALARGGIVRQPDSERLIRETCTRLTEQLPVRFDFTRHALENGMSYSSFRRLFKEHTGLAPNQYLLDLKLRKARNLLAATTLQVQQVAAECGFDNHYYFTRLFKQHAHCSPLAYRKKSNANR
jgi:AraC-like DNA-binding protein